ncbi:MAG: hypothetical protein ACKV2T_22350 [Kofleriaceae bacterium]
MTLLTPELRELVARLVRTASTCDARRPERSMLTCHDVIELAADDVNQHADGLGVELERPT